MDDRSGRWWRRAVAAATVGLLFLPVALDRDGLPLSTYPMYSRARSQTVTFATAAGVDGDGRSVELSLETVGASDDPLVVVGELRAAIRDGTADRRCREIAARVDADGEVVAVEVVTETHDVVARVADEPSVLDREVHATCEVPA